MITIKTVRDDLGEGVALLECDCPELAGESWEFLVNLAKDSPGYNPKTKRVRCPRCGDEMFAGDVFRTQATTNGDHLAERIAQTEGSKDEEFNCD
jgi:hypothetical protein